ncbi:MAG: hypothetical protein WA873_02430, partial [Jannaschia helgolandensis]
MTPPNVACDRARNAPFGKSWIGFVAGQEKLIDEIDRRNGNQTASHFVWNEQRARGVPVRERRMGNEGLAQRFLDPNLLWTGTGAGGFLGSLELRSAPSDRIAPALHD